MRRKRLLPRLEQLFCGLAGRLQLLRLGQYLPAQRVFGRLQLVGVLALQPTESRPAPSAVRSPVRAVR
ncbi:MULTISPECIES: hypothetical protein [Streptacidiphilus]|uniref:Uncharacterized protein n=1 Tax=Streptacidiphilus cavernicola TaxID=3342716 RepID=A0ABV6UT00_9ACTN|nr:hypothetical protein [Streptacidiphilus jeojiense]